MARQICGICQSSGSNDGYCEFCPAFQDDDAPRPTDLLSDDEFEDPETTRHNALLDLIGL
jgi:hypothetical protein